ncbi:MAG: heavy-metal-associated domain-containing protein [Faecousia sp.]
MKYAFTYLDCQQCRERIHCDDCEKRLTEALLRLRGIRSADIQMATKCLSVDTDLDADTLEEALEDLGIFVR